MLSRTIHQADYDHVGLHRSKDAGTSGFSGYHNRMITRRSIPAGGEIFVDYGEEWFNDRVEDVGNVPYARHFHDVDIFLTAFKRMSLMYVTEDNPDFAKDLWEVIMSQAIYDTRGGNALPFTFEDMLLSHGVGAAESRRQYSIRSKEYLLEHGRCMDNIRPGISTIPQAGRGAFASRFIPEGGLVAPGPVIHMANRTSLNIYAEGEDGARDKSKHVSMQLLLNYCFGHKQSTVLLCPYTTPSAYINHNSELANVKVVWSSNSTPNHNPDWLEEDVNFLKETEKVGLSLDFIAIRDIEPGEEGTQRNSLLFPPSFAALHYFRFLILTTSHATLSYLLSFKVFLDYGPEWQAAWNKYIKEWSPLPDSDKYITASLIQEPLRTVEEQLSNPYPPNVIFYCHYDDNDDMTAGRWPWEEQWISIVTRPCKVLSRRGVEKEIHATFDDGTPVTTTATRHYYDMAMLSTSEIEEGYIRPTFNIPDEEKDMHVLVDVPRYAIKVADRLYAKDEFLTDKYAFRHEMMLDEIFPESWKNLR